MLPLLTFLLIVALLYKIIAVRPYSPADSVNKVMLEFDDVGLCVDKNQYLSAISHFETLQTRYKREKVRMLVIIAIMAKIDFVSFSTPSSDLLKEAPLWKTP